ncbi:MFS transporter [Cohnella lubricantis]|uniref:MFS transporter n=2 Tax=Cohnella lubricantis TaxID=2163172 RepID=A0A841TC39_9BACL|nr:MFS transporter [Cohnella lubricantis]
MAYLTIGLGELAVGAVLEPMIHAYGVRYSDGGQLVMNQFLGGLVGTLSAPWLIRRVGRKKLLLFAIGLMAAAELAYTALPPWGVMLAIGPLTGFGFGTIETLVGSLVIAGAGERANTAMGRVETCFGIGALIIPFAGAALIGAGQWRLAFAVVGLLAVITLALWVRYWPARIGSGMADSGAAPHGAGPGSGPGAMSGGHGSAGASSASLKKGGAWGVLIICAFFFFVYVGMEMSFVHYLPSLLVQSDGISDATATLAAGLFWGAMTIGRLVAGNVADRIGGASYLLSTCAIGAVIFLLMSLTGGTTAMFVLTFFLGLFLSGMFAVALVFANRAVPGVTERTTSILIASGLLGGAILPKMTGWCLDQYDAAATRWFFTLVAVLLFVAMAVAAALTRRQSRTDARVVTE